MEDALYQRLVAVRHWLHAHPELSGAEHATTAYLRQRLSSLDIRVLSSGPATGLVAVIGRGAPVIALRADIDALPVAEATGLAYASENPGVMHACGHDLHMAALLGAAELLKAREDSLGGTIKLIFQPAEEVGTGALEVLATGLLADVEAFIGFHNIPSAPAGEIGLRDGGVMAAVERFAVRVTGAGSHAAYPHEGRDAVLGAAAIVTSLQQLVARNVPPLAAGVVSVTHVTAGDTWNVLPDSAFIEGTIRSFDDKIRAMLKKRFVEVVTNTAKAYGVAADIDWVMEADLTYNDPALTALCREALRRDGQTLTVPDPSSAGEDFANYRRQAPTVFALIGSNGATDSGGLHAPDMIARDATLPAAVHYFVASATAVLSRLGGAR